MTQFLIKVQHYFILLATAFLLLGCSKSDSKVDCHSGFNLHQETAGEVEEFSNAAIEYSQDPSAENCNRYKNALSSYVDVLEKYEKCALEYGSTEDWRETIREAREGINDLQCQ